MYIVYVVMVLCEVAVFHQSIFSTGHIDLSACAFQPSTLHCHWLFLLEMGRGNFLCIFRMPCASSRELVLTSHFLKDLVAVMPLRPPHVLKVW